MALSGRFLADFESFYAATRKAEVELRSMETGAGRVGTSLNKMVDGFSGRKLVQDATLVTEAVERIGGVSKLTESEQIKVNRTVTEAIAKYAALGQTAPPALHSILEATKAAIGSTSSLDDHLQQVQRHVSAFSGDKIIQEAQQMARAITEVGGASKLTASEQARVNSVVTEAIAKYGAMGQKAPQALRDLAAATKAAIPPTDALAAHAALVRQQFERFSGDKVIQDAHAMTRAIEQLGGASKLTASEQTHVNATVTEAIAKYKALGIEAPAALQKIAADTKQIPAELGRTNTGLSTMISGLKSAAGLLGIVFSARALAGFVGGVFDAASKVKDLSTQLGISTDAVQGFKFAAEQSGSSLDAVGTAIQKMNQNLAGGDKSTVKALADAGLRFEDIRAMRPEDAFLAITDAIQQIEDPMVRARVALELFGRGAAELLPAIQEGMRKTADGATKMSEQTIKDLEAAQDAWERLFNKVTIVSGGIIASAMSITEHVTGSGKALAEYAANAIRYGLVVANQMASIAAQQKSTFENLASMVSTFKPPGAVAAGGGGGTEPPKPVTSASLGTPAVNEHAKTVKALMDAFSGAKVIATANLHLEAIVGNMRQGIPLAQMTRERQDEINKAMASAMEVYRALGTEVPPAIRAVYFATLDVSKGIPIVAGLSSEFSKLGTAIKVLPTWVPSVSGLTAEFGRVGSVIEDQVIPPTKDWQQHLGDLSQALAQLAQISGTTFGGIVRDLATLVSATDTATKGVASFKAGKKEGFNLAGILEMSSGILGIASAALAAGKAIKNMFFGGSEGRDLVKDFAGSMGGFDALHTQLGALGAEGEKLWIALTQGVGKNNPEQAKAAIEAITAALAKGTSGTVDPMADITAAGFQTQAQLQGIADNALDMYERMRGSGLYTASTLEAAWKKYQAALLEVTSIDPGVQKAMDAVKALDDELSSLFKSIENEAPEEIMGVIEANTRAQIAGIQKEREAAQLALEQTAGDAAKTAEEAARLIEQTLGAHDFRVKVKIDLDDPSGILSGKVAGGILSGGSGSGGSGGEQTIITQTYLDSQQIAETLVRTQRRLGG